jgi:ferrous iron transport protein A
MAAMNPVPERSRGREAFDLPTLDQLPSGASARVQRIVVPAAQPEWERQLQDLGFVPGAEVALLRRAPWGDPLVIAVEGSRFALRRAEARCVQLEPAAQQA